MTNYERLIAALTAIDPQAPTYYEAERLTSPEDINSDEQSTKPSRALYRSFVTINPPGVDYWINIVRQLREAE